MIVLVIFFSLSLSVNAQRKFSDEQFKTFYSFQKKKKKFRFNKEKYRLQTTKNFGKSGIDTSIVYLNTFCNLDNKTIEYNFIRYFSTGEVFYSLPYLSQPTEKQFNDLSYGGWSMFAVDEDGIIKCEKYVRFLFTFEYLWSKVEGDSIVTYKSKLTRWPWGVVEKGKWVATEYKVKLLFVLNRNW